MEDIIQLLPDHISNQIAAGEVIQRPASAVKEMIENSIDAGAKNIKLLVKDSGRTLIQVIDDGIGMSPTDARLCFEKHATSKIKKVEDIFHIMSKGFRGEALASIAAVAQVELKTRRPTDDIGTFLKIEGSQVLSQEPISMPAGTQLSMKNIFYNIPARRNFLKSDNEEMRQIMLEFDRLAMAHPEVAFQVFHNDVEIINLPLSSLKQRIVHVLGKSFEGKLVPIEESLDYISISGFVSRPDAANSKTKAKQYLFVNNRFVKSQYIQHAVYQAYKDWLGEKEYPFYVLYIAIDPSKIDINVSPTKQEIKFEDEQIIYQLLNATIRRHLMQLGMGPIIDFGIDREMNNLDALQKPLDKKSILTDNQSTVRPNRPLIAPPKLEKMHTPQQWEKIFEASSEEIIRDISANRQSNLFDLSNNKRTLQGRPIQYLEQWILAPTSLGILIIDQKRAHERILYEELSLMAKNKKIPSQQLIFPTLVELNMQDSFIMTEILPDMEILGFGIGQMGHHTYAIQGVPADLPMGNEKEIVLELLEEFKNSFKAKSSKLEHLLISLAKIASVRKKQHLTEEEVQILVEKLFAAENGFRTPTGKLIYYEIPLNTIEGFFR